MGDTKCSHCKMIGHNHEACWWLHPHLRLADWIDHEGGKKKKRNTVGEEAINRAEKNSVKRRSTKRKV
jgi:hypothetical protein